MLFHADPTVRLYHGDAFDFLAEQEPGMFDVGLSDFPYAKSAADGARGLTSDGPKRIVDFGHFSEADTLQAIYAMARVTRRWMIVFMDHTHVDVVRRYPPRGWQFVRHGAWWKRGAAPQFSGDRPAQGWESVAILHPAGERMHWHGGGHPATWDFHVARGTGEVEAEGEKNATEKPVPFLRRLLELFADEKDLIIDPFCGKGGTLVAAKELGLKSIGVDLRAKQLVATQRRLRQAVLPVIRIASPKVQQLELGGS